MIQILLGYQVFWFIWYKLCLGVGSYYQDQSVYLKSPSNRIQFSSNCMSIVHAYVTLSTSTVLLLADWWSGKALHSNYLNHNTDSQVNLFLFGLSYFIAHTLFLLSHRKYTVFLIHHIITGIALSAGLYLGQLGPILVWSYFLGEVTNPVQLAWQISREWNCIQFYSWISPIFTKYFVTVRCLIIPIATYYLNGLIWTKTTINPTWKITMTTTSLIMNVAGYVWSYWLVQGYLKFQTSQAKSSSSL